MSLTAEIAEIILEQTPTDDFEFTQLLLLAVRNLASSGEDSALTQHNGGLQNPDGVPVFTIIIASVNTAMYAFLAVMVFVKFVSLPLWKQITTAALTAPEYIGFVIWLTGDSHAKRVVYLVCQYFSFFSLLAVGIYQFVENLFEYFVEKTQ